MSWTAGVALSPVKGPMDDSPFNSRLFAAAGMYLNGASGAQWRHTRPIVLFWTSEVFFNPPAPLP